MTSLHRLRTLSTFIIIGCVLPRQSEEMHVFNASRTISTSIQNITGSKGPFLDSPNNSSSRTPFVITPVNASSATLPAIHNQQNSEPTIQALPQIRRDPASHRVFLSDLRNLLPERPTQSIVNTNHKENHRDQHLQQQQVNEFGGSQQVPRSINRSLVLSSTTAPSTVNLTTPSSTTSSYDQQIRQARKLLDDMTIQVTTRPISVGREDRKLNAKIRQTPKPVLIQESNAADAQQRSGNSGSSINNKELNPDDIIPPALEFLPKLIREKSADKLSSSIHDFNKQFYVDLLHLALNATRSHTQQQQQQTTTQSTTTSTTTTAAPTTTAEQTSTTSTTQSPNQETSTTDSSNHYIPNDLLPTVQVESVEGNRVCLVIHPPGKQYLPNSQNNLTPSTNLHQQTTSTKNTFDASSEENNRRFEDSVEDDKEMSIQDDDSQKHGKSVQLKPFEELYTSDEQQSSDSVRFHHHHHHPHQNQRVRPSDNVKKFFGSGRQINVGKTLKSLQAHAQIQTGSPQEQDRLIGFSERIQNHWDEFVGKVRLVAKDTWEYMTKQMSQTIEQMAL